MAKQEIKCIEKEYIQKAYELEINGFPEDEVASLESLTYRQENAPSLFYGYFQDTTLIGIICGTRYSSRRLVAESMTVHQPNGENVCIHAVCVDQAHRRKGIALQMVKHYIEEVKKNETGVKKILLVCKSPLIPLYTKAGFVLVSKSDLQHGKDTWYEMELVLQQ